MLIYVSCETPEQITDYFFLNKLPTTCINWGPCFCMVQFIRDSSLV